MHTFRYVRTARSVLGVIYNYKSGNTSLKWRQTQKYDGKVTGDASSNSLSNMAAARVITLKWVEDYVREKSQQNDQANPPAV